MATYIFRDINTGETFDVFCKISEVDSIGITNKKLADWLVGRKVERLKV